MARKGWAALSAAYRRRLERHGITQQTYEGGFRLVEARGHGVTERAKDPTIAKYYRVVDRLARGETLSAATRAEHTTIASFNKLNAERRLIGKTYREPRTPGKKRAVFDRYERTGPRAEASFFDAGGTFHRGVELDQKYASIVCSYDNAVKKALATGDTRDLKAYKGRTVYDVNGTAYTLQTNLGALRRLHERLSAVEREDLFKRLYHRTGGRRHAA